MPENNPSNPEKPDNTPNRNDIIDDIVDELVSEARQASDQLPFRTLDIEAIFSSKEMPLLLEFLDEIERAQDDNEKKVKLIQHYGHIALKLMQLAKIIV